MTTLAQQIETAIDSNDHTEATMIAARALNSTLGFAYITILREISDTHDMVGYIDQNHQKLRDSIQKEVFTILKLQGKI